MTAPLRSSEQYVKDNLLGRHLGELVDKAVETHGDLTAFSCILPSGHHAGMTFREMGQHTDRVAAFMREELGLVPGDVVAIQCPNTLAYPVLAFGLLKAGLTITNINPLYTSEEAQHQIKDSGAKVLFCIDLFADRLAQSTEGTNVEHIFTLSLVDLFPTMKKAFLSFVLKRVKKLVPEATVPVAHGLDEVLRRGATHLAKGVSVSDYTQHLEGHETAFYQYTGGTTGRSKGAELTHYNVVANITQGYLHNGGVIKPGEDILALVLPMYHVYALAVGAMSSMYHGAHVVLVPSPRPVANLKTLFDKFDISIMPGVNTLYIALMQEKWFTGNPPSSLRFCYSGAAPLQPQTAKEWIDLTNAPIFEGYGLTESTCAVTGMPLKEEPKIGSCGKAMPGTELRIVGPDGEDMPTGEAGELWIRGPQVMKGYLGRPEATRETITEDGWLKTGDVATLDEEGYLSIVDRMKDMVIVSGFNVYPADVEDVLTRCDGVVDAAVVGVNDPDTGEKLIAYIVSKNRTGEELQKHCREHLTAYKVPKIYEIVDELPKSPVGKVLRRELRDMAKAKYE